MREIKFRGKDKSTGRWWHGSYLYLPDSDSHHIMPCGTYKPSTETLVVEYVEVDPATVGQYTGLKDVNDNEIYEGDILNDKIYDWEEEKDIDVFCAIVWDEATCGFVISDCTTSEEVELIDLSFEWEVIGNIHDNPELLKGGEEYA